MRQLQQVLSYTSGFEGNQAQLPPHIGPYDRTNPSPPHISLYFRDCWTADLLINWTLILVLGLSSQKLAQYVRLFLTLINYIPTYSTNNVVQPHLNEIVTHIINIILSVLYLERCWTYRTTSALYVLGGQMSPRGGSIFVV